LLNTKHGFVKEVKHIVVRQNYNHLVILLSILAFVSFVCNNLSRLQKRTNATSRNHLIAKSKSNLNARLRGDRGFVYPKSKEARLPTMQNNN